MIKIINYAHDFKGLNKKTILGDKDYIKLVTEVIRLKDNIITFNIRLNKNDDKPSRDNPVIEFLILESKYNYKKSTIKNYDELLFDQVRNIFKNEIY